MPEADTRKLAASLSQISLNGYGQTEVGYIAKQTVLACFAGTGDQHTDISLKARAQSIGIRRETLADAQRRTQAVARHDVQPAMALESNEYIWTKREKRSDATSEEVPLAKRYWHFDDVSRAICNSGDRDMWHASKAKDASAHPRRQLIIKGGGDVVYRGFLAWPPYVAYKVDQNDDFKDPGRTTFLQTRCPCLVLPKMKQCAYNKSIPKCG